LSNRSTQLIGKPGGQWLPAVKRFDAPRSQLEGLPSFSGN
jgi:hypothetical protein